MSWDSYNEDVSWGMLAAANAQLRSPAEKEIEKIFDRKEEARSAIATAEAALVAAKTTLQALEAEQVVAKQAAAAERDLIAELKERSKILLAEGDKWQFCRQSPEAEIQKLAERAEGLEGYLKLFTETMPRDWGVAAKPLYSAHQWMQELSDAAAVAACLRGWQGVCKGLEKALADTKVWRPRLLIRYESGQGKVHREGYVLTPDGFLKEPDKIIKENWKHCGSRWFYAPEDLVLVWSKTSVGASHEFEVVHLPVCITEAQREGTRKVLEDIDADWSQRTGISGACSPGVGQGWLLEDGSSVAYGGVSNHTKEVGAPQESLSQKLDALKGRWGRT